MKTVRRIFAIAVAVLLIAMMIPAASAASNTVSWTCNYKGYTYDVYQVATYDSTTGEYTAVKTSLQDSVDAAITEAQMATLAENLNVSDLTKLDAKSFTTDAGSGSFSVDNGIYFIKCTQPGPNNKTILQDSIVVFPNKNGTTSETINLTGKVNEGEPTADKNFKVGDTLTKADQSFGTTADTKTITYVISADIAGSATSKLTSYVIVDKMGTGLNTNKHDIVSVVLKNGNNETALEYEVVTDPAVINCSQDDSIDGQHGTADNTFGVSIKKAELDKDSFYTDGNKVVVTYTTELDYATADVATAIPNTDDMIYGNDSGRNVVPGKTVNAFTYQPFAKKIDASTGNVLTGKSATFGLYKDEACTQEIATAQTDTTTGIADFQVKLPADTYYIKETVAPEGYNLNSTVKSVTLGGTTGSVTVEIEDTPAKLPSTGGTGTLIFTIIGGSLVLLAAVLFLIVMKKRSSAK